MTIRAMALVAALAIAGDGGKIQWGTNHARALAEARESGRPLMIFFTAEWCGPCKALKAGAFSDENVVKASEGLVRLLADADRNPEIFQKYAVESMPTVIFFDPDGKEVGRLKNRSPEAVASQFKEIAEKHGRNPKFLKEYGPALAKAKEEGKPLGVLFFDEKAGSQNYARLLDDEALKEFYEKIVFVKVEAKKGCPVTKQYNVTAPPILYVVDPAAEKPEENPYRKIYGQKTARDFKKDFEEALKKAEKK
jgi:thiol-disulfide isomerase/thioredoxin